MVTLHTFSRPESYFLSRTINFLHNVFSGEIDWLPEWMVTAALLGVVYVIVQVGFRAKYGAIVTAGLSLLAVLGLVGRTTITISEVALKSTAYHPVFATVEAVETQDVPLLFAVPMRIVDAVTGSFIVIADRVLGLFTKEEGARSTQWNMGLATGSITDRELRGEIGEWIRQCFRTEVGMAVRSAPAESRESALGSVLAGIPYDPVHPSWFASANPTCRDAKETLTFRLEEWFRSVGDWEQAEEDVRSGDAQLKEYIVGAIAESAQSEIEEASLIDRVGSWMMHQMLKALSAVASAVIRILMTMVGYDFFAMAHGVMMMLVTGAFVVYAVFAIAPGGHTLIVQYALLWGWFKVWPLCFLFLSQLDRIVGVMADETLGRIQDPFVYALIHGGESINALSPVSDVAVLRGVATVVGFFGILGFLGGSGMVMWIALAKLRKVL